MRVGEVAQPCCTDVINMRDDISRGQNVTNVEPRARSSSLSPGKTGPQGRGCCPGSPRPREVGAEPAYRVSNPKHLSGSTRQCHRPAPSPEVLDEHRGSAGIEKFSRLPVASFRAPNRWPVIRSAAGRLSKAESKLLRPDGLRARVQEDEAIPDLVRYQQQTMILCQKS